MTPERVTRMYGYMETHLSSDMIGQLLVEKMGDVIVTLGDKLTASEAELAKTKADLAIARKRRVQKAKGKRVVKAVSLEVSEPATLVPPPVAEVPKSAETFTVIPVGAMMDACRVKVE